MCKYVCYVLNEWLFILEIVVDLFYLRKVLGLSEFEVVDVLNDVVKCLVKFKGILFMCGYCFLFECFLVIYIKFYFLYIFFYIGMFCCFFVCFKCIFFGIFEIGICIF